MPRLRGDMSNLSDRSGDVKLERFYVLRFRFGGGGDILVCLMSDSRRFPSRRLPQKDLSAGVQQMDRDEIKVEHCYSMAPIKRRRTIARVTNLFRITAMAAQQEGGTETLELNPVVVRFVWRHAAYPTGWSPRRQQLLLDDFALAAEKEVACT
jgi:hypothetical protein